MKNFSRSLAWLTVSEIIFNIAGYVIHSATGRILGPEGYGRFGLVTTLTTMIIMLIGNGIPTAMSKYLSEIFENAPEKILGIKRKAIKLQVLVMGAVTVIFFLLAPIIALSLGDPTLTPLFQISALIIPAFAAASFYFSYFTGLHFFRLQAVLKSLRALFRVIFIVGFAYSFGVPGAVSGYIAAPLAVFTAALVCDYFITKKYFPAVQNGSETIDFSEKTLLQYAWPLTLFLLFYELVLTLDLYLVKGILHNDTATGLYNAAITVGRIPYYLFYALTIILLPAIAKTTAEKNHEETGSLVSKSLRLMAFLLFPMVALMSIYSGQILEIFYGHRYIGATVAMQVISIGVGFLTVFYVLSFALNGAGLVKIPMRIAFSGFIGSLLLNILLIPRFGIVGAAYATTIVSFILMVGILIYTERHFAVRLSNKTWIVSLLSIVLIVLVSRFLPNGKFSFIFSGAFLFVLYFAPLALTGVLTTHDFTPFKKLLSKKA